MVYHFKQFIQQQAMMENSHELNRWVELERNRIGTLRKVIGMLDRDMTLLNAESQSAEGDEKRKIIDTLNKLAGTLLAYQSKLDEYQKSSEPLTLIVNQLKIVLTEGMSQARTDETKKVLTDVMQKMSTSMDELGLVIDTNGDVKYGGD